MAVIKVIELLAESPQSWEEAARLAVAEASRSVRGIRSIYIKEFEATVQGGQISNYRVNAKITFEVEGSGSGTGGQGGSTERLTQGMSESGRHPT
jgi:flavin-binding protein dodecin